MNATYALAKGVPQELDLASVVNGKEEVMYSFLSFEWAFMADVDIDSERYRMFGGMRFTMSAIAKLLSKHKNYTGKVRYLSSEKDTIAPPKYHNRAHDPLEVGALCPTLDCLALDSSSKNDPETSIALVEVVEEETQEWKELTGPYHMFWGVNVSHTGAQGYLAPNAAIDDGYYYMLVVEGAYSRLNMTRMLFGLEDGTHIGKKQVQLIRTRAFTLQVDNPEDRLCVDGELFSGPEIKVCCCFVGLLDYWWWTLILTKLLALLIRDFRSKCIERSVAWFAYHRSRRLLESVLCNAGLRSGGCA